MAFAEGHVCCTQNQSIYIINVGKTKLEFFCVWLGKYHFIFLITCTCIISIKLLSSKELGIRNLLRLKLYLINTNFFPLLLIFFSARAIRRNSRDH